MSERIDTKCRLLYEQPSQDACIYQTTSPIAPAETGYHHWEKHAEGKNKHSVMLMLPDNHRILVEVRNICATLVFGVLLQSHPHEMGVPKALVDAVRVLVCISPSMVSPVFTAPPANRALYSTTADTGQEDLQRQASVLAGQSMMSLLQDMMRRLLRFI